MELSLKGLIMLRTIKTSNNRPIGGTSCKSLIVRNSPGRSSKMIPLTQGKCAIVDAEDYDRLMKYGNWYLMKSPRNCYAVRRHIFKGLYDTEKFGKLGFRRKFVNMHRQVLQVPDGNGLDIDHINHNGLDNRKINLRICTRQQTCSNRRKCLKTTQSQYKGINKTKSHKWEVHIGFKGKIYYLGTYKTEIEAAKVYDKKAKEIFGAFAHLNFQLLSLRAYFLERRNYED